MSKKRKLDLDKPLMELAEEGWSLRELLDAIHSLSDAEQTTEQKNNELELRQRVSNILLELGIPAHVKGYGYIRRAIELAVQNDDALISVTKVLYPMLAEEFSTTASKVERSIRNAIELLGDRGDMDAIYKYFGSTISAARGKPTNLELITMLANRLRLEGYGNNQ